MPPQHDPQTPCRRCGSAKMCFHVLAMSSVGATCLGRCCQAMDACFCASTLAPVPNDIPLRHPTNPIVPNVPEKKITKTGQPLLSPPYNPPARAQCVERIHTTPMPPLPQKTNQKMQKHGQRHQNALRHFLLMSATIRCIYAPGFDHADTQGVQCDPLGGIRSSGAVGGGNMLALRACFACAASAIILYVL